MTLCGSVPSREIKKQSISLNSTVSKSDVFLFVYCARESRVAPRSKGFAVNNYMSHVNYCTCRCILGKQRGSMNNGHGAMDISR